MSFSSELKGIRKRQEARTDKVFRAWCLNVMGKIIRRTPVDTGRLRSNWNGSVGKPDRSTRDSNRDATAAAKQAIAKGKAGDTLYLTNNLPYAATVERGSSKQAPVGMLRVSVLEAGGKIE